MYYSAKTMIIVAAAALALFSLLFVKNPVAKAGDDSYWMELTCGQLWYERNSIFAAAGHCFKTKRARRVFGRNCFPPYGKLHRGQRSTVRNIRRAERRKGC